MSHNMDDTLTLKPVSFFDAFLYWLKLGFISFGGPAGQISIMHQELVEKRRWISEKRFLHALNYTMVLPGPEAQQLATYIGWLMHGTWGGVVAGALFVLPSLFILILLAYLYLVYGHIDWVAGIFYGLKPAVVVIVLYAALRIGKKALTNMFLTTLALLALLAIFNHVPFPYVVISALLLGALVGQYRPQWVAGGGGHGASNKDYGPALIDDQTPVPEHARFRWPQVIRYGLIGLAIWLITMFALWNWQGWNGVYTQMAWFFTKAALVTFGGAYAVLPYVFQGAVANYAWLSTTQMMDGLALGETTPGPLIMVVAFVGFIGGWNSAVLGTNELLLAGVAGACIVTLVTFLPSFLFILLGAPAVEATRHTPRLSAPLAAVTAAVVGVIVNLALFFAYPVLWPDGFAGAFEWPALVIGAIAALALFGLKIGIMGLLGLCAVLGLAYVKLGAPQ